MELTPERLKIIRKARRTNDPNHWNWGLTFIGRKMGHNYRLYYVIDRIMETNPGLKGIIELGTGRGALTMVLGLWGIQRNIPVITFDHRDRCPKEIFKALNIWFFKANHFGSWSMSVIESMLSKYNPILFICDGGNKKKEFNYWAPKLKPGSIICAHDWNMEIDLGDIKETVDQYCEPVLEELWEAFFVQFSIWRIKI